MTISALLMAGLGILSSRTETGFPASGQFSSGLKSEPAWGNAVAIHPYWVITAAHVGKGATFVQGKRRIRIVRTITHKDADLALCKLAEPVKHFAPPMFDPLKKLKGREVTLVGFGEMGVRFAWGWDGRQRTAGTKRSATNIIDAEQVFTRAQPYRSSVISYDLDDPATKAATAREGGIAAGDSGGAWYVSDKGRQKVVAISAYVLGPQDGRAARAYGWGAQGFGVHLYSYKPWIQSHIGK